MCEGANAASLQALFDLEATNNELKADLRDLYITSAKEVDAGSRKAIIVHVSPLDILSNSGCVDREMFSTTWSQRVNRSSADTLQEQHVGTEPQPQQLH
jgi:hypothetical protein